MTETQNTSAGYPSDYIQRTKAILDCLMSELEMVRSQRSELDDRERGLVERIAPLSAIVGDVHTADDVDTQPTPTAGEPAPHLLLEEGGRRPSEIQRDARAGTPRAGSFNSNGFVKSVEAVVDVLRREGPTHYRDIYEKVAETGVIVVGKDPAAVLLARFSRDSRVHRVGSGTDDLIADAT